MVYSSPFSWYANNFMWSSKAESEFTDLERVLAMISQKPSLLNVILLIMVLAQFSRRKKGL